MDYAAFPAICSILTWILAVYYMEGENRNLRKALNFIQESLENCEKDILTKGDINPWQSVETAGDSLLTKSRFLKQEKRLLDCIKCLSQIVWLICKVRQIRIEDVAAAKES